MSFTKKGPEMDEGAVETFLYEVGECVQNAMYLAGNGRHKEAAEFKPRIQSFQKQAKNEGIEIIFFQIASRIRKSHKDFPELKTKFSPKKYMGAWIIENPDDIQFHFHMFIELVSDGNGGHVTILPGNIIVEDHDAEDADEPPDSEKSEEISDEKLSNNDFRRLLGYDLPEGK